MVVMLRAIGSFRNTDTPEISNICALYCNHAREGYQVWDVLQATASFQKIPAAATLKVVGDSPNRLVSPAIPRLYGDLGKRLKAHSYAGKK